jgi:aspartate-semialdehyde dehydrogenase
MINIGIVGVGGLVGKAVLESISLIGLNLNNIRYHFYGSKAGTIEFNNQNMNIQEFRLEKLNELNYVILAVDNLLAKSIVKYCFSNDLDITIIDNSSQFRMDSTVPLIIPEINIEVLEQDWFKEKKTKLISNPNCVSTIVCMGLSPLVGLSNIKELTVSTYQAASGAGYKGLDELETQTKQYINSEPIETDYWKIQYVGNVFSHNSSIDQSNGFNEEELKLINETKKILGLNSNCSINPTCIRVPTIRSHCASVHVKFENELTKEQIVNKLEKFNGLVVMDGLEPTDIPNPVFTTSKTDIYVGRIRSDIVDKTKWNFWISGDQLLKGAGYNSVQILEHLLN